jgi:serine/threonine protein kinase
MKELAEGAFGKVYMAEMITGDNFKSVVAIKLLHGKWTSHEEIVQRSRDEARVLGLLHHRNIVRVEDLTSINGQCAVIMEYLAGVDLKHLIRYCRDHNTPLPRRVAFEIIASTASALDAAYHQPTLHGGEPLRVIHRDIKPSNVMLTIAGEVKVLDFGTARANFEHREAVTQALAFGSAAYMAPERIMGDPDTPSGDILSLGITLYELLAYKGLGKIFVRKEKFDAAISERIEAIDLTDMDPDRAAQIRAALRLMLAYNPADRPAAKLVVELMEALSDEMNDGSIRRFCREVVTPCHGLIESPASTSDSFSGSTLFEDTTRVRDPEDGSEVSGLKSLSVGPLAERSASTLKPKLMTEDAERTMEYRPGDEISADELPALELPATGLGLPIGLANHISLSDEMPDPSTDIGVRRVERSIDEQTRADLESSDAPTLAFEGHGWLFLILGVGSLVLIMAIIALIVVALTSSDPAPPPVAVELPDGPAYLTGGVIEASRADGKGGSLSIVFTDGDGAKTVISGNETDFSYRWDGTGTLKINDLDPGTYRAVVRGVEGTSFLEANVRASKMCTYEYNLSVGGDQWAANGCR